MKHLKPILALASLLTASNALAMTYPSQEILNDEASSIEAALAYAERSGKNAPVIEDYTYGTEYSVGKVIYVSRPIDYCGAVPKIMVFEDKSGDLRSIRYRAHGECRAK